MQLGKQLPAAFSISVHIFIVNVCNQFRHKVGRCADSSYGSMTHGRIQQRILAAKKLKPYIPGSADKLCLLSGLP